MKNHNIKNDKSFTTIRVYKEDAKILKKEAVVNDDNLADYLHKIILDNEVLILDIVENITFYKNLIVGIKEMKAGKVKKRSEIDFGIG